LIGLASVAQPSQLPVQAPSSIGDHGHAEVASAGMKRGSEDAPEASEKHLRVESAPSLPTSLLEHLESLVGNTIPPIVQQELPVTTAGSVDLKELSKLANSRLANAASIAKMLDGAASGSVPTGGGAAGTSSGCFNIPLVEQPSPVLDEGKKSA